MRAGLAQSAAGQSGEAERWLRAAVERTPALDRAWYNLGLLLAQRGQLVDAQQSLAQAERLRPSSTDYAYARATVLWRLGDQSGARAAAQRVLARQPEHAGALEIVRRSR